MYIGFTIFLIWPPTRSIIFEANDVFDFYCCDRSIVFRRLKKVSEYFNNGHERQYIPKSMAWAILELAPVTRNIHLGTIDYHMDIWHGHIWVPWTFLHGHVTMQCWHRNILAAWTFQHGHIPDRDFSTRGYCTTLAFRHLKSLCVPNIAPKVDTI